MSKLIKRLIVLGFVVLVGFSSCNTQVKQKDDKNPDEKKDETKVLELKKLEIGSQKFLDLSSTKLINANSVENEVDKVKVIAEATPDVDIKYTPDIGIEKSWNLEVGENTLSIKLTRGVETPVVYTIKLLRKGKNEGSLFNGIIAIKTATAEYGTTFPQNFNEWKDTLLKEENGKKNCIIDSIYPEDYLGFIFILKTDVELEKFEQKSMNATEWIKMYHTKDERVNQNTATPYRVYYFAKYSFSKGYAEQASIKLAYKDGREDEFILKAKNGVISE